MFPCEAPLVGHRCTRRPVRRLTILLALTVGPFVIRVFPFMRQGTKTVRIPNEHSEDIGIRLLRDILRNGDISEDDYISA